MKKSVFFKEIQILFKFKRNYNEGKYYKVPSTFKRK